VIDFRGIKPIHTPAVWSLKIPPRVHFFGWQLGWPWAPDSCAVGFRSRELSNQLLKRFSCRVRSRRLPEGMRSSWGCCRSPIAFLACSRLFRSSRRPDGDAVHPDLQQRPADLTHSR
jgi:hypothetical protein